MSVVPASVSCDSCGKNRQDDANRWKSLRAMPTPTAGDPEIGTRLIIWEGTKAYFSNDERFFHACGETCLLKLVSKWCATGKLE